MHYIRPWVAADAPDLAFAISNPNVLNNLRDGLPYPYTPRDALAYINSLTDTGISEHYAWAIQANGKAIGNIGVTRQPNIHHLTAEMGYYIAQPYWGQGYATNAIKEVCRRVFESTDIVRIYAEPFAHNLGSCRALEKAGFSLEGVLKSNAFKNGQMLDMKLYALIR